MVDTGLFYCGTSGLVLPVPNKLAFPEAFKGGTRLTYYASLFNSIEVNSSFYKIPRWATLSKWVEEVPAAFRFTIKLWRGITHETGLAFRTDDVRVFMRAAEGIASKKGALLVQLPPGTKVNSTDRLKRLLDCILATDAGHEWKIAVEFRHQSWYTEQTDALLSLYGAGRVLQDMPTSLNWEPMSDASFIYLRYHGPAGDYKGGYGDVRLWEDAIRIKAWAEAGKTVYAYFNNTIGDALVNVQRLRMLT